MTQEREDYMRRQDAEHDMIRMRQPMPIRQPGIHPDPRDEIIRDLVDALKEIARIGDGRNLNWGDAQDAIDMARLAISKALHPVRDEGGE